MPFALEIFIFFVCICFGVCGALWLYGGFAASGHGGFEGFFKSATYSIVIPAFLLAAVQLTYGFDDNYLTIGLPWATGLILALCLRHYVFPADSNTGEES